MTILDRQLDLDRASGLLSHAELMLGMGQEFRPETFESIASAHWVLGLDPPDNSKTAEAARTAIAGVHSAIQEELKALRGSPDFVPAASWQPLFREALFEHMRAEFSALLGAIRVEPLWTGFGQLEVTEPIQRLCLTGGRIVIRAVGEFLVGSSRSYRDQAAARDFFPADTWEETRSEELSRGVARSIHLVNKQVAHLTTKRPLPEDYYVYAPSSLAPEARELLALLHEFTHAVADQLVPEWWAAWLPPVDRDLYLEPS